MKPICVPCKRFYRPKTSGFYFLEGKPESPTALPGNAEPDSWSPYKLWCGDLWECPGCHAEIIIGTGRDRITEHYEFDFARKVKDYGAKLQINDC